MPVPSLQASIGLAGCACPDCAPTNRAAMVRPPRSKDFASMTRSATDVMHDIIYAAVIDAVAALKSGAGNLPNTILRDLGAIHANTTFADLPEGVRKAIEGSVRAAFTRLLKEGYSVSSGTAPPPRAPAIP